MYKAILLAADGSENSYRAAQEVKKFYHEDAIVTILNIIGYADSKSDVLHGSNSRSLERERLEKLSKITDFFNDNNIRYETLFEHGEPKETVVKVANSGDYDVVLLGTRGLNGLQEMVLGSVSHKVAKRANIPVMIVK
ncbi:universal stress protein [Salinicoccus hispanicus]|uniref:Universal stress protein n=1 Tax=Salinicoccus hispanicus TaxID=157225 RepID=A0A6N8U1M0_9STAP|nr:universal stress protein [Salinicoccus hispanicus]MXQ51672.1 universal stress protein [Salinicoccus hispanicus]